MLFYELAEIMLFYELAEIILFISIVQNHCPVPFRALGSSCNVSWPMELPHFRKNNPNV